MATTYDIVLAALVDYDYNDGGMMHWYPSGKPTDRAIKLAERITRELEAKND